MAIRDPKLIRQIAVRDFDHFVDHRNMILNEDIEPLLGKSVFMLKGQRWRDMRSTLTPAFTGSKTRQMFQLVIDCGEETMRILRSKAEADHQPYVPELKDVFSRCTTDVIATAAFGIQVGYHLHIFSKIFRSVNLCCMRRLIRIKIHRTHSIRWDNDRPPSALETF